MNVLDLLIQLFIVVAFIIVANVIVRSGESSYRRVFDRFLLFLSLPFFLLGIFFVLIPDEQLAQMSIEPNQPLFPFITNSLALGILLQAMAVWGIVFSLHSTRQTLARKLPVNPDSAVHALALVWSGWLVGGTLIQLTQIELAQIIETIGTLDITNIVLQQSFFVLVAILGVGLGLRRTIGRTLARLGLEPINGRQILIGLIWILFLVIVQFVAGGIWALLDPGQAEIVNELNLDLQSNLDTVGEWFILALAAGVGEEILFRGALQPVLGLWFTSLMFALVHVQYGFFTPATVALFIIGFSLAVIRKRHNTTLAIFVHFGYDFALGLIALLATNYFPF